jgi:hypothetical protein
MRLDRAVEAAVESHRRAWPRVEAGPVAGGSVSLSAYELSQQRCLTFLQSLREALYPQGVAPARVVDDSVLDGHPQRGGLVPGAQWQSVGEWDEVVRALTREATGPGSTAFVLAGHPQGIGHAFAVHALPAPDTAAADRDTVGHRGISVVWVDLSGEGPDEKVRVSSRPPAITPAQARAVIVDGEGRVVSDALPTHSSSDATATAVIDTSLSRQYGADSNGPTPVTTVSAHAPVPDLEAILEELWANDPSLRHEPFDMGTLARRILHMRDDEQVDIRRARDELFALVRDAVPLGRASSLAALGAHHIRSGEAAATLTFTVDGAGSGRGVNWTAGFVGDVDASWVASMESDSAFSYADAPWQGTTPLLVLADHGDHEGVEVPWYDGTRRRMSAEEIAEYLFVEAGFREGPIVLAWPFSGDRELELPRLVAHRTSRRVWSYSSRVHTVSRDSKSYLTGMEQKGDGLGDWVSSDPGLVDTTPIGTPKLYNRTLVDAKTQKPFGRTFQIPGEIDRTWHTFYNYIPSVRNRFHVNAVTKEIVAEGDPTQPADYHLFAHGLPGEVSMTLGDGTVEGKPGKDFAAIVKRRPSVKNLSAAQADGKKRRLFFEACYSAAVSDLPSKWYLSDAAPVPFTLDPLEKVSTAQHLANETRLIVPTGGTRKAGFRELELGVVRVLYTDMQGNLAQSPTFWPEPTPETLDDMARKLGLHHEAGPVSDFDRDTALRLVRALRQIFGNDVETHPDYEQMKAGIGAVELMRRADPDLSRWAPHFTMDLLERVVRAHHNVDRSTAVEKPQLSQYADTLRRAQAWVEAESRKSGPSLSWFVSLPTEVRKVVQHLEAGDRDIYDSDVRETLGLTRAADLESTHYSKYFWVRVAAEEVLTRPGDASAFVSRIVHSGGYGQRPSDTERDWPEAQAAVTWALAHGFDPSNTDALAAAHLIIFVRLRVPQTSHTGARARGGNYATATLRKQLDATVLTVRTGQTPAPWVSDLAAAPLIYTVDEPTAGVMSHGRVVLTDPDGTSHTLPENELVELLAWDPRVFLRPLDAPLVLAMSNAGNTNPDLPRKLADRLGRTVWYTEGTVDWIPQPSGSLVIDQTTPTASVWKSIEPEARRVLTAATPDTGEQKSDAQTNCVVMIDSRLLAGPGADNPLVENRAAALPSADAADFDAVSTYFTHYLQNQQTPESVQAPSGLVYGRADQTGTHQSTALKGFDKPVGTKSSSPANSLGNVISSLPEPAQSRAPGGVATEAVDEAATTAEGPDGGRPLHVGGSDVTEGAPAPVTGPALATDDPWLNAWARSRNWTTDFALTRYVEASGLVRRAVGYRTVIGQDEPEIDDQLSSGVPPELHDVQDRLQEVSTTWRCLGEAWRKTGDTSKALDEHQAALDAFEQALWDAENRVHLHGADQATLPADEETQAIAGQQGGLSAKARGKLPVSQEEDGGDGRSSRPAADAVGHATVPDDHMLEAAAMLQEAGFKTLFIPGNDPKEQAKSARLHTMIGEVAERLRLEGRDAARALARSLAGVARPDDLRPGRGGLYGGSGRPPRPAGSRVPSGGSRPYAAGSAPAAGQAVADAARDVIRRWNTHDRGKLDLGLIDAAVNRWAGKPTSDSRMNDVLIQIQRWRAENGRAATGDKEAVSHLHDGVRATLDTLRAAAGPLGSGPAQPSVLPEQRPGPSTAAGGRPHAGRPPAGASGDPRRRTVGAAGAQGARSAARVPGNPEAESLAASLAGLRLDDGPEKGWNWTRHTLQAPVATKYVMNQHDSNVRLFEAPWPVTPLLVVADGNHQGASVPEGGGTWRWTNAEELTQILADAVKGENNARSIVLAWSGSGDQGLDLPRLVAARTGRRVWSVAGTLTLTPHAGHFYLDSGALGDWVPSDPGELGGTDVGGSQQPWEHNVSTRTIVSKGRRMGRTWFTASQLDAGELTRMRNLSKTRTQVTIDPVTRRTVNALQSMPAVDYWVTTHGNAESFTTTGTDGQKWVVHPEDFTRALMRRPSMRRLMEANKQAVASNGVRARRVIHLDVCLAAAQSDKRWPKTVVIPADSPRPSGVRPHPAPFTLDPLGALSPAQHVANATRLDVYAGDRNVGVLDRKQDFARFVMADVDGTPGRYRHLRPEPTPDELNELIHETGLSRDATPSKEDRDAALRLVRAMRLVFGDDVETHPDYKQRLAQMASVELMRRKDALLAASTPYFTMNLLDHVVRSHLRAAPAQVLGHDEYRQTLEAAARDWRNSRRPLTAFVGMPVVRHVARTFQRERELGEARIRSVFGLAAATPLTRKHVADEFWVQVATEELFGSHANEPEFVARILHLRGAPGPAQAVQARTLVAWALAHGFDSSNTDALAAAHLMGRGLTRPETQLSAEPGGRNFAGLPLPRIDAGRWVELSYNGRAPWMREDGPVPLVVTVETTPVEVRRQRKVQLIGPDSSRYTATEAEFAELLARDHLIYSQPLQVPLLLAMSRVSTSNPDLPHTLAKRLGRPVWFTDGPVQWMDSGTGPWMIARISEHPWKRVDPGAATAPASSQMSPVRSSDGPPRSTDHETATPNARTTSTQPMPLDSGPHHAANAHDMPGDPPGPHHAPDPADPERPAPPHDEQNRWRALLSPEPDRPITAAGDSSGGKTTSNFVAAHDDVRLPATGPATTPSSGPGEGADNAAALNAVSPRRAGKQRVSSEEDAAFNDIMLADSAWADGPLLTEERAYELARELAKEPTYATQPVLLPWETTFWTQQTRTARDNRHRVEHAAVALDYVVEATGYDRNSVAEALGRNSRRRGRAETLEDIPKQGEPVRVSHRRDAMLAAMVDLVAHEVHTEYERHGGLTDAEEAGKQFAHDLVRYFITLDLVTEPSHTESGPDPDAVGDDPSHAGAPQLEPDAGRTGQTPAADTDAAPVRKETEHKSTTPHPPETPSLPDSSEEAGARVLDRTLTQSPVQAARPTQPGERPVPSAPITSSPAQRSPDEPRRPRGPRSYQARSEPAPASADNTSGTSLPRPRSSSHATPSSRRATAPKPGGPRAPRTARPSNDTTAGTDHFAHVTPGPVAGASTELTKWRTALNGVAPAAETSAPRKNSTKPTGRRDSSGTITGDTATTGPDPTARPPQQASLHATLGDAAEPAPASAGDSPSTRRQPPRPRIPKGPRDLHDKKTGPRSPRGESAREAVSPIPTSEREPVSTPEQRTWPGGRQEPTDMPGGPLRPDAEPSPDAPTISDEPGTGMPKSTGLSRVSLSAPGARDVELSVRSAEEQAERVRTAVGPRRARELDREGLAGIVDEVVNGYRGQAASDADDRVSGQGMSGSSRERSEQVCLELLHLLRNALFPQGVAPARVADDSVLDVPSREGGIAAGDGWRPVRSWQAVVDSLTAGGPGSAAFVLARRTGGIGHAIAAYALPARSPGGDTRAVEVVWVDPQSAVRDGARLPRIAPAEARAVVVGSDGRVLPDALPGFQTSASVPHALVDPSTHHQYGALGGEFEIRRPVIAEHVDKDTRIAQNDNGLIAVLDHQNFYRAGDSIYVKRTDAEQAGNALVERESRNVVELVTPPMAVLPGERRNVTWDAIRASVETTYRRIASAPENARLDHVFRREDGWTITQGYAAGRIGPAPLGRTAGSIYSQFTIGVPVDGILSALSLAEARIADPRLLGVYPTARKFGSMLAKDFVEQQYGPLQLGEIELLTADARVRELWGYGWLFFNHVSALRYALLHAKEGEVPLAKNGLPAASRHPLNAVRKALLPEVRKYLRENGDKILDYFAAAWRPLLVQAGVELPNGVTVLDLIADTFGEFTMRDAVTYAIKGSTGDGGIISQDALVGMDDRNYQTLDNRHEPPLVLLELRAYAGTSGSYDIPPGELTPTIDDLTETLRANFSNSILEDQRGADYLSILLQRRDLMALGSLMTVIPMLKRSPDKEIADSVNALDGLALARAVSDLVHNGTELPIAVVHTLSTLTRLTEDALAGRSNFTPTPPGAIGQRLQQGVQVAKTLTSLTTHQRHNTTRRTAAASQTGGGRASSNAVPVAQARYPQPTERELQKWQPHFEAARGHLRALTNDPHGLARLLAEARRIVAGHHVPRPPARTGIPDADQYYALHDRIVQVVAHHLHQVGPDDAAGISRMMADSLRTMAPSARPGAT